MSSDVGTRIDQGVPAARIRVLSPDVAAQIAAGEVVERPASILKELLENSLDASATHIHVELEQGGLSAIRVFDNGSGIHRSDLELAFRPHATSKLTTIEDIWTLSTLGFRGEALATVASVAKVACQTKTALDLEPYRYVPLLSHAPAHSESTEHRTVASTSRWFQQHAHGTQMFIADLFFNVPVRRKFLKSSAVEYKYCEEIFLKLALLNARVHWTLQHNGQLVYDFKECRSEGALDSEMALRALRMAQIQGESWVRQATRIQAASDGVSLWGWVHVGAPSLPIQGWYVNGRFVKDRFLNQCFRQATAHQIASFGWALFLNLPSQQVDVNVHPGKLEVRFADPGWMQNFILESLRQGLGQQNLTFREEKGVRSASGKANGLHSPSPPSALQRLGPLATRFFEENGTAYVECLNLRRLAALLWEENATPTRLLLFPEPWPNWDRHPRINEVRLKHALERVGIAIECSESACWFKRLPLTLTVGAIARWWAEKGFEMQEADDQTFKASWCSFLEPAPLESPEWSDWLKRYGAQIRKRVTLQQLESFFEGI